MANSARVLVTWSVPVRSEKCCVACLFDVGRNGDDGSSGFVELETILKNDAVDEAAVDAGVAQLRPECMGKRLTRHLGIEAQKRRETP